MASSSESLCCSSDTSPDAPAWTKASSTSTVASADPAKDPQSDFHFEIVRTYSQSLCWSGRPTFCSYASGCFSERLAETN